MVFIWKYLLDTNDNNEPLDREGSTRENEDANDYDAVEGIGITSVPHTGGLSVTKEPDHFQPPGSGKIKLFFFW